MATKKRVNLSINAEVWDRTLAAVRQLPGDVSVSGLVEQYLTQMAPILEGILQQAKEGDASRFLQFMDSTAADLMSVMGTELGDLRKALKEKAEEEVANK